MRRVLAAWGPAAIWAAFLFFLSSRETLPVDLSSGLDKLAHFGAYLVLGFLSASAAIRLHRSWLLAIAVGLTYGAIDELHQATVPGRFASLGDWVADAAGTTVGVLLYILVVRSRTGASSRVAGASAEATKT